MHFILPNDPQSFSHKSGMNGKGEETLTRALSQREREHRVLKRQVTGRS
jgi:hypothetical protein